MNNISGYKLLYEESPNSLTEAVQECIDAGWQPLGSVKISITGWYIQAVVMYEEEE